MVHDYDMCQLPENLNGISNKFMCQIPEIYCENVGYYNFMSILIIIMS